MLRCVAIVGILLVNAVIGLNEDDPSINGWSGSWFPKRPGDPDPPIKFNNIIPHSGEDGSGKVWGGKWFPNKPGDPEPPIASNNVVAHDVVGEKEQWLNKLYPKKSAETFGMAHSREGFSAGSSVKKQLTMGILDPECDDTMTNLWLDYDPKNLTHQSIYICTENRTLYEPNQLVHPELLEYVIPREYSALHKCMNETITYPDKIPTFGTHRSNWPIYGEYNYVPVQRWLHSLEHGAIVALYHPCANRQQTSELRKLIKSCMYRHVITPYEKLTTDRPFALVAWGKSLEMSYIDRRVVVGFIRMNALQAPEKISRNGQYSAGLVDKASIVSDADDSNLCPNM